MTLNRSTHPSRLARSAKIFSILLLLLLAAVLWQFFPRQANAAVTLVSFTATYSNGQVLVEWETATEIETAGFYVQRSTQETTGFTRISSPMPAAGEGGFGATYSFTDNNITEGTTYYYILEEIETSMSSVLHGPISVYAGSETLTPTTTHTPTRTPTATATGPTQTPSRTPTRTPSRTPSRTPTRTRTPLRTAVPTSTRVPTQTLTPTHSVTPSLTLTPSLTITPTNTLEPFPTLEYTSAITATETATPTPSLTASPMPVVEENSGQGGFLVNLIRSGALARAALVMIVIAIWAILAIGAYLYIRYRYN